MIKRQKCPIKIKKLQMFVGFKSEQSFQMYTY